MREHSPAPAARRAHRPDLPRAGHGRLALRPRAGRRHRAHADRPGHPGRVRWMDGGHDGVSTTADDDEASVRDLARALPPRPRRASRPPADLPVPAFVVRRAAPAPARRRAPRAGPGYAGVGSATTTIPRRRRRAQPVLNPPGGAPGSLTRVPTSGGAPSAPSTRPCRPTRWPRCPGSPRRSTPPPSTPHRDVVGAPRVRLTVTSTGHLVHAVPEPVGGHRRQATLTRQLVAPVTVTTTPGQPTTVDVALPAATYRSTPAARCGCSSRPPTRPTPVPRTARADRVSLDSAGCRSRSSPARRSPRSRTPTPRPSACRRDRRRAARAGRARLVAPAATPRHAAAPGPRRRPARRRQPRQDLRRRPPRRRRRVVARRARPGRGPARAQRRRQDHHAADGDGPDPPRLRHRRTCSASRSAPVPPCSPAWARSSRGRASCRTSPAGRTSRPTGRRPGAPGPRPTTTRSSTSPRSAARSTARCAPTARACGSASASPRRCWACPRCWCSTSRPTVSTRRRSRGCARSCTATPPPAAPSSSPATCSPRSS